MHPVADSSLDGTIWYTHPALVLVQARHFAPNYAGPGRWILFHPATRQSFLAIGGARHTPRTGLDAVRGMQHQDVLPDIVSVGMDASAGASLTQLTQSTTTGDLASLEQLVDAGLLVDGEKYQEALNHTHSFISRYHLANFDFPFHDYFDPDWREKDLQRMQNYSRQWAPPPLTTDRLGSAIPLPEASIASLDKGPDLLEWLATLLKFTFGATGEIEFLFGTFLRKTSPSGGARHPTEGILLVSSESIGVPKGAYHYDSLKHCLVRAPSYDECLGLLDAPLGLLLSSHVERAMYRYREFRSFRPVLMDLGHIAETLRMLCGVSGTEVSVKAARVSPDQVIDTLHEPPVVLVEMFAAVSKVDRDPGSPDASSGRAFSESAPLVTNPTLHFTFESGGLVARVVWPHARAVAITLPEFLATNHCLPSARGDRDTTPEGICDANLGLSIKRVRELAHDGVLLPRQTGDRFHAAVSLWSKYGWYISLLAHLECVGSQTADVVLAKRKATRLGDVTDRDLIAALFRRKTTRVFAEQSIAMDALNRVLAAGLDGCDSTMMPATRCFLAAHDVSGLQPGLYERQLDTRELTCMSAGLSRYDVRAMTCGQSPSSTGAATIWLVREIDESSTREYEGSIIDLGRIGQRVCVAAEHENIGVFLTPAVADKATLDALGVVDAANTVTYLFGLGVKQSSTTG